MRTISMSHTLGTVLTLLLFCSCAAENTVHPQLSGESTALELKNHTHTTPDSASPPLPADVTINEDAGRGNFLFVTLQLQSGEELLFMVDTGSPSTLLDRRLEPRLGKRLGTRTIWMLSGEEKAGIYNAPLLKLNTIPLMTSSNLLTVDLTKLSSQAGRPLMGILGMDCLRHYCIQLDFETGKMRFLGPGHLNSAELGKAFPMTLSIEDETGLVQPLIRHSSLLGGTTTNLVIDTGCNIDGLVEREAIKKSASGSYTGSVFKRLKHFLAVEGVVNKGVGLPVCVWDGNTYTDITVGEGPTDSPNWIGLRFLARHLVTMDFPKQMLYLKQTSTAPLSFAGHP